MKVASLFRTELNRNSGDILLEMEAMLLLTVQRIKT